MSINRLAFLCRPSLAGSGARCEDDGQRQSRRRAGRKRHEDHMLLLKYRGTTTIPPEAECIRPDHLAGLAGLAIPGLPLQHGNTQVPLGEFFEIAGNAADGEVVLEGECSRVKWLGAAMAGGRLRIEGHAGMHLGAEMKGGLIEVRGNAG